MNQDAMYHLYGGRVIVDYSFFVFCLYGAREDFTRLVHSIYKYLEIPWISSLFTNLLSPVTHS